MTKSNGRINIMAKASPAKRKAARANQKRVQKKAKLGSGKRFAAVAKAAKASGAKNPAAVAAAIGRKKYGAKKMAKMAAAGRKRKKR
jgi:hypothetical protein